MENQIDLPLFILIETLNDTLTDTLNDAPFYPDVKDGRRWLQPPFPGISGLGDSISGGFNRRLVLPLRGRPIPVPVAEADRTSSFSCSGVSEHGG